MFCARGANTTGWRVAAGVVWAVSMSLAGCQGKWPSWPSAAPEVRPDAEEEFQAGANRPPTAKTLYAMAKILAVQDRDAECEYLLMQIIRGHPEFLPAYCDLAELRVRQGRVEDAIRAVDSGLSRSPGDAVLLNNLGMCHMLKADYPRALEAFTRAAAATPWNARCRGNMAAALGMMGRYDESLAMYEQVVSSADAHYNLGVLCKARRDDARAAIEFARAGNIRDSTETGPAASQPVTAPTKPR